MLQAKTQIGRLLIAIVAWPAGILAAIVLLFVTGESCSGECQLEAVSSTRLVLWLAVAFGPGILATRAWWKGRRDAA